MISETLMTLSAVLAWLYVSHVLTKADRAHCGRCGETLVQGLDTHSLYCIRCRRWQR